MHKGFKNINIITDNVTSTVKNSIRKINSDNSPPDSDRAKIIVKSVFALLAVLSVLAVIIFGIDLSPSAIAQSVKDKKVLSNATGDGYPVDIDGSRTISIASIPNGTAVLTDTNYMVLNDDGQEVVSAAHYMASPVMKTAGRYTLLYDENSTTYVLKTLSGNLLSDKTENSIVTGALSRSGKFALVTHYDTAFSYVCVYSKSGSILHKWKSSSYYISDIAISPSGNYIAMSGVNTDGGVITSRVIVQKVGGNQNLREYTFNNTLLFSVDFTDTDRVTVVGDDLCAQLWVNEEKTTTFDYNGENIVDFDFSDNGNIALVLSQYSDGKNCHVVVINSVGETVVDAATQLTSPSVELTGNCVNLVSQAHFYSYDFNGQLTDDAEVPADGQSAITSGSKILVNGVTTISEVK